MKALALLPVALLGLAACASTTETNPSRPATEQLSLAPPADLSVHAPARPVPETGMCPGAAAA